MTKLQASVTFMVVEDARTLDEVRGTMSELLRLAQDVPSDLRVLLNLATNIKPAMSISLVEIPNAVHEPWLLLLRRLQHSRKTSTANCHLYGHTLVSVPSTEHRSG